MKKIMIVGPAGSGKSTLSRRLSETLSLPLYHLDNIWWNPDRTHVSREQFDERLNRLLEKDEWIIDGDYARTYEPRMQACDTVIFLNYPLEVCLQGAQERVGRPRDDIPWADETYDADFHQRIISWFDDRLPRLQALLEKYRDSRNVIVLDNRKEADELIAALQKEREKSA